MNTIKSGVAIALVLAAVHAADAAAPGPTGLWLDQSGRAGIDIQPCGEKLCGSIVWLKAPLNDQGKPKTDIHNSDTNQQSRPLCGLTMLGNFVPDGDNAWTGGFIYDPEHGETYKSNMHMLADGTLSVRGYVGISLFGRSQIWTRPTSPLGRCKS